MRTHHPLCQENTFFVYLISELNCIKFAQLILRKTIKIVGQQMSYFKAKMHLIRFRLGLHPRPHWGSSQRSPNPLAGFKGPTFEGRGLR